MGQGPALAVIGSSYGRASTTLVSLNSRWKLGEAMLTFRFWAGRGLGAGDG